VPILHCPRPDRLGDSWQALPAVRHRGQLAHLVSHFPVTHYEKLRRYANDFAQFALTYKAERVGLQAIYDIALRLDGWLETICKRSGAGVRISTSTAWFFGLG
jgi:hypothetical protein